ncbi:hypothetical protein DW096_14805 [Bacteroides sp. AM07-18]|uniref:Uncharacterized protein n=1 Tax=Bacteroides uniformis TaxID=820 RepID=A0A374MMQ8_BACUN|nr:hypothetical protein DW096_14805 [Bacteroides sp. AM07-18]RGI72764.1 hypothetical protein DXD90_17035 [Bacteroides uniformis]RJU27435.1 hypothetical protein DW995_12175 [Bacteroides sp. AM51-7]RJU45259.1 hypothetical protein DW800_07250 [Bacteroides sp. AM32-11AC]RJU73535.1 hypothetical protein DW699_15005 [Bacteroides sp. AM26-2]RJV09911.1 hypothetical protein DWZ03_07340 [Bacteroides sp. AF29-11]
MDNLQIYQKSVSLQCVFHSIRFKVNKGWSTAVLLFLCSYVSFWGEKITRSMLSFLAYRFVLAPFLLPLSH